MADADPVTPATIGRRERKRLETRNLLISSALDLFVQEGFENVTVAEIAERADVDASTFFRHFGSKEAVVFAGYSDFVGHLGTTLRSRPPEESLFTAMKESMKQLVVDLYINLDSSALSWFLSARSPSVWAQSLVFREELVVDFAKAIAERIEVDPDQDPRPYMLASAWVSAADWYRGHRTSDGALPPSVVDAIDDIAAMLTSLDLVLRESD